MGEYFLTQQQESVRNKILEALKPPKLAKFISIVGSAGTGKTLLTYDIAKNLIENKSKPLIIHCGQLNDGHAELIKNNWAIIPIKNHNTHDLASYDLVIIDEAQRIRHDQLNTIVEQVKLAGCCCIFSHDKLQTLANWEETRDISTKIGSISSVKEYKLSEKIRTNKEIAAFIKMLFKNTKSIPISSDGNIEINFFKTNEDARSYLDTLDNSKWEALRFTPSQYKKEHHEDCSKLSSRTSHQIIGQEFDGIAVIIDKYFAYDENGNLTYRGGAYYDPPKMLFQNITRARKRLNLVIVNNAQLLSRCIAILNNPEL